MSDFPTVRWKQEQVTFTPDRPVPENGSAPAALIFPFYGDRVVLADITTRGWCIPSGHVEAGETFEQTVRREAYEEAGATLSRISYLGYFTLTGLQTQAVRYAPTFIGEVSGIMSAPTGNDTRGMQLVNTEDIADLYFAWDRLLAAVFAYAFQEKERRFPVGVPLSTLTQDTES